MADSKRLSLGGRVATPRLPTVLSMEQVVARALGAHVRIQTTSPQRTVAGYIFAVAPGSPFITLTPTPVPTNAASSAGSPSGTSTPILPPPTSYTVVPLASIASFALVDLGPFAPPSSSGRSTPTSTHASGSIRPAPMPLPTLDSQAAGQRAIGAIGKLRDAEARLGKDVSRETQQLFDALHRTLPVEWDGPRIVVLKSVIIAPPYGPADCRSVRKGGNAQELTHIKKVLESERKKIAAANGAAGARVTPELKKGG